MSPRFLINIDQLFKPLYLLLNVLKKGKNKPLDNKNFIVLKFFGLGSITRIAHVMNAIGIEKNQVTFITLHKNKTVIDVLDLNAMYINTKQPLILIHSVFKIMTHIWKQKKTAILDMERASNLSGLFRLIVGVGKDCRSFYFKPKNKNTRGQLFVSLKNKPATNAIAELFNKTYNNPLVKAHTTNEASNKIVVNINAGNYLPERKFTLSHYATLIKTLHDKNQDWHFYLTGIKSEFNFVETFKTLLKNTGTPSNQITNIAGQHRLPAFINSLKDAKLFITNDSGPLHLAHIFGIKTVGIWGPTSSKLVGYQNSAQMLNLETNMECSPCFFHPKSDIAKYCNGDITCFKSMNPNEMASKIISFNALEKDAIG